MIGKDRLKGRTVLITGASGGLGERFARICAEQGAAVVIGARRKDRLQEVAEDIESAGGAALALSLDVTDEASLIAAFDAAEERFGIVDSVIANAGIEISGRATEISAEDFDKVFQVNVRGVFITAREAAKRLQAKGCADRGRIVLISSITARICSPGVVPYSASKAAVSHLGRLLSREWARTGPNVNCIAPGYIASDMVNEWFSTEGGQKQLKAFPRRRLVEEDGLDGGMVYLLSDEAKNTTGAEFTIDDGQSL
mgnify:CR=1 FL=1